MYSKFLILLLVLNVSCSTYQIAEYHPKEPVKIKEHVFYIEYSQREDIPFNMDAMMQQLREEGHEEVVTKFEEGATNHMNWSVPTLIVSISLIAIHPLLPLVSIIPQKYYSYRFRHFQQDHIIPTIRDYNKSLEQSDK